MELLKMSFNNIEKNAKKTILIVTERFYPEEFRINDLALEWAKEAYKVKVLTQVPSYPFGKVFKEYKNKFYQKESWGGVEVHRIKTVTSYKNSLFKKLLHYFNFIALASILALFIGKKSDKIFVYHLGPLTDVTPAIVIKKIFKKKITIWTTDIWPDTVFAFGIKRTAFREKVLNAFVKFVYKNCENILVSSKSFVDKLKFYVFGKEIYYIPHWADELITNPRNNLNDLKLSADKRFHFTFAGNIGKVQNLEYVIKGFGISHTENKVQLNIIGDGWNLEKVKKIVINNNFENIVFWGRKPSGDMYKYYELSDVLVISLKSDPLLELTVPSKFQSYLLSGKPIYAIINGDVRQMVEEYELGLTADPDDLEDIKRGFEKFVTLGKDILMNFGNNSKKLYFDKFQKAKNVKIITSFLFPIKKDKSS